MRVRHPWEGAWRGATSLVLITIGSVTGVSIAALFTGGLLPGLVLAITLSALVWWRYRGEDLTHVARASGGEIVPAFIIALPAVALPQRMARDDDGNVCVRLGFLRRIKATQRRLDSERREQVVS